MTTVNSIMKALRMVVSDSKTYKEGHDTILYSEHAIKIGSHNGQWEVEDSFQTSQTQVCVAQVLSSICFGKATRMFDTLTWN